MGVEFNPLITTKNQNNVPFYGRLVYFSGSIKGAPESDPEFAWKLVQYMGINGADVLSEHVAARNQEEMDQIRARRTGQEIQEMLAQQEPWFGIRKKDTEWVDQASHVVALVNAASHGVGMEIERAILKPRMGLNVTPILCLVHEQVLDRLSYMIKGVSKEECPVFYLNTYTDIKNAQSIVYSFLTNN